MSLPTAAVISTYYSRVVLDDFRQSLDSLFGQSYPRDKLRLYLYVDDPVPADPELALLGRNSWKNDQNGGVVYRRDYPVSSTAIREGIARGDLMSHPCCCMRRTLLTTQGMRYRELYLSEDIGFLFDVLSRGLNLANLQERLMYWRVTGKFFERHHFRRNFAEYRAYMQGMQVLHGLSAKQVFPLVRLVFRLLSNGFARQIYRSPMRNSFLLG